MAVRILLGGELTRQHCLEAPHANVLTNMQVMQDVPSPPRRAYLPPGVARPASRGGTGPAAQSPPSATAALSTGVHNTGWTCIKWLAMLLIIIALHLHGPCTRMSLRRRGLSYRQSGERAAVDIEGRARQRQRAEGRHP